MSLRPRIGGWRRGLGLVLLALLTLAAVRWGVQALSDEPEIALVMGGTYQDMRKRSTATFSPLIVGRVWFGTPKSDARLRFIDLQYGFVTPLARFFTVSFHDNLILDVRMSPQIEPLLLDDALKVVLDLQDQWRQSGWVVVGSKEDPPFADTAEWRARLRDVNKRGRTFWQAGDKYQAMLLLGRFEDSKRPNEERYLISLELAKPWVPFDVE